MITLILATAVLGVMTYFGIEQYRDNTLDEDVEKTTADLQKMLFGLVFVIIVSLGIMAFSHYTEKPDNVQSIQVEAN